MTNTGGFEVVAEVTRDVLQQVLEGAWDQSIIPHSTDIASGTSFGPYQLADGVVNIPRSGLHLDLAPADDGVQITLPSEIQVEISNPPIPSATYFNLTADVVVTAPIDTLPSTINVGIILEGLPRSNVQVTLTSGDPISPITLEMIEEYLDEKYSDGTIPHTISQEGATFGVYSADAYIEVYNDPNDSAHQITATQPASNQVKITIPIYLQLSSISLSGVPIPTSPMGIEADIAITATLDTNGHVKAMLSTATVDVENVQPASGIEGTNYTINKNVASTLGVDLEALLKTLISSQAQTMVASIGDIEVTVPTVSDIQDFIGDQVHAELITRGNISVWTPETPEGSGISVRDVSIKVLSDALAFCINDMGSGNTGAITNFIPSGQSCAIAINGDIVLSMIWDQIRRPEEEGGFGSNFPSQPATIENVDGHDATLNSLDVSLTDGAIVIKGDVTVKDAILGCLGGIDVDADFEAEVGLRWDDNADGSQTLVPYLLEEPDIDMSILAWIISFLVGFVTFGLVGVIIAAVVMSIVDNIAERIGGSIVEDHVTGQIRSISAWPQTLENIGTVEARFENPVDIDSDSINFPDLYIVTAIYALVIDALAQANGPYVVNEGTQVQLVGGPSVSHTDYLWDFGDGNTATGPVVNHTYSDNGIYVAKLTTIVNQSGGSTTREFAKVNVRNVSPSVEAGPNQVVDEGQEVEYTATFTDQGWPDTHTAIFNFGDDSQPTEATVNETNNPPRAQGTASAKHAYCDNGEYTVTVKVFDDDGGIGVDILKVTVNNVAPEVDAGEDMFAYICTPITLVGRFTDPGWCDTHKGFWDFGECDPSHPAKVIEKHEPPAGTGIVAATHIYKKCGKYYVECIVIDDDGGLGRDFIVVRVVDVLNGDFEGGFRTRPEGVVANEWEPYVVGAAGQSPTTHAVPTVSDNVFSPEEFIVHSEQRSQMINCTGGRRAGIYQKVGANIDWDYQVSCWYHVHEQSKGRCRLGIDPDGGVDPQSSSIVWSEGGKQPDWTQLAERVTAKSKAITIFMETFTEERYVLSYFDDVTLIAYPCPLREEPPSPPEKEECVCVDWKDEEKPEQLKYEYEKKGFKFTSNDVLQIVQWGNPAGQLKLMIPSSGLTVKLPFTADRVVAHVVLYARREIKMEGFDEAGNSVGSTISTLQQDTIQTLELKAEKIASVILSGGGDESLLIDLCACRKIREKKA
jgi:PKD repeat protein